MSTVRQWLVLLFCWATASAWAAQQVSPAASPQSESSTSKKPTGKHSDVIFLVGTVFTEQGFSLPRAQLQLRRAGERKVRAEDVTNRVGEFSLHAPRGIAYELTVKAKGFEKQTLAIDSNSGDRENLVFRLKPVAERKK